MSNNFDNMDTNQTSNSLVLSRDNLRKKTDLENDFDGVKELLPEKLQEKVAHVLTDLEKYKSEYEPIKQSVDDVEGKGKDQVEKVKKQIMFQEEMLIQMLLVVDGISGDGNVRAFRKKLVVNIQNLMNEYDGLMNRVKQIKIQEDTRQQLGKVEISDDTKNEDDDEKNEDDNSLQEEIVKTNELIKDLEDSLEKIEENTLVDEASKVPSEVLHKSENATLAEDNDQPIEKSDEQSIDEVESDDEQSIDGDVENESSQDNNEDEQEKEYLLQEQLRRNLLKQKQIEEAKRRQEYLRQQRNNRMFPWGFFDRDEPYYYGRRPSNHYNPFGSFSFM